MSRLYTILAALLFLGIVAGVAGFKGYQMGVKLTMADWDAAKLAATEATAKSNIKTVTERKQVNHENQNRDDAALNAYGCERGWVRDRENCPIDDAAARQVRDGVFQHKRHDGKQTRKHNE